MGAVDTVANLSAAIERLGRIHPSPQALVFTGDLADKAEPEVYRILRETVEPAAERWGAQVVWVMGNHDERAPYAEGLFGLTGAAAEAPQDRVYEVDGLRIVALDTSVPRYHHGELTEAQLAWLADILATPAEHGTLLAMHHPPIPVPMLRAAELIELFDQHRLADVVTGTDVRLIMGGHYHYSSYSTLAGIPVSVASATCYTCDPAPLARLVSGVDGAQAFTMVHLYDDRVVNTVVPTTESPEISGYPADMIALVERMSPQERIEMISRKDSPFNTGEIVLDGHVEHRWQP